MMICIYGDYGVGKDTFADFLVQAFKEQYQHNDITVQKIKSYTTRPKRYPTENTHTFISKKEWEKLDNFIAKTEINNQYYGATIDQLNCDFNIYVVDKKGLMDVISKKYEIKNSKKIGSLCIIKITRPPELINVEKERLQRKNSFEIENEKFFDEITHLTIENNVSLETLQDIAASIPILLPYFKLIE